MTDSPNAHTSSAEKDHMLIVPMRYENDSESGLNRGIMHAEIGIHIDPDLGVKGVTQRPTFGPCQIVLREPNDQVLLHELLHLILDGAIPTSEPDPHGHQTISRMEVAIWETGWRRSDHRIVRTEGPRQFCSCGAWLWAGDLPGHIDHVLATTLAPESEPDYVAEFFTEDEKHALRMGALAWSGGRGVEHELYDVAARVMKAKLAARPVRRVCSTCGTEWTADVRSCPTCPEVSTPPGVGEASHG